MLAGHNRGQVYVDNPDHPGAALIWAQSELYFLVGTDPGGQMERSLAGLLSHQIRPAALAAGDDFFQVELYPAGHWAPRVQTLLAPWLIKPYQRVAYTFDPAQYTRLPDWRPQVPPRGAD